MLYVCMDDDVCAGATDVLESGKPLATAGAAISVLGVFVVQTFRLSVVVLLELLDLPLQFHANQFRCSYADDGYAQYCGFCAVLGIQAVTGIRYVELKVVSGDYFFSSNFTVQ